ncbi:MAG: saccharopine dehydrogenase family protein, partial [Pseudomonadota bacterium]
MARIHWIGTGLSTVPGIRRLIGNGHTITLWNRTVSKAEEAAAGLSGDFEIRAFSMDALKEALQPGDVGISMLPGDFHVPVATACLDAGAHFVSSSYISPEMRGLDEAGKAKGLCLVNEVGLDPGIDHLMAHVLMDDYRKSAAFSPDNRIQFRSYCGGVPKIPNPFRYKFSWSPLGVLKALKSPSKSIQNGEVIETTAPWDALSSYEAVLPDGAESFEVYPNRDCLPFMDDYGFDPAWTVDQFVRGTLRLNGWADAWDEIFKTVGDMSADELAALSARLEAENTYEDGEPDRVVLCVDLQAQRDGEDVFSKSYVLDAAGDATHTAMARLVSIPVSYAVEAVLNGELPAGVSAAPSDPDLARKWLAALRERGEPMELLDR